MILLFKEILVVGGPVMWLILACSVVAAFIFLEKLFYLHRVQVNVGDLVKGLLNVLKRGNIVEAVSLCDDTPGPAAHVLRSAILSYEQGEDDVSQSIQDASLDEMPRLEARTRDQPDLRRHSTADGGAFSPGLTACRAS